MHPDDRLAEELAQSASALRSLARDLTGPGDDADDLVQETMLRAWRSPPQERRGLRPWLATILRNLASNRRRDERRRKAREQEHDATRARAAGGSPIEPETLRAVTEALWQLPEPYQRTLTLRYFAGRTPTEIADETRTPLPTVKSRLRRGLQMLRERLEREQGSDWRAALCAATGLPFAAGAAATAASVLLMAHTTKILFGTAALAAATWLLWPTEDISVPTTNSVDEHTTQTAAGKLAAGAPTTPIERQEAEAVVASRNDDLAHPFSYELRCLVVDRDGLLVPNAYVAVAPSGGHLNQWLERTGDTGEVTIVWQARAPSMTVQIGVMVHLTSEGLREIEVHAGAPNQVALLHNQGGGSGFCQAARQSSSNSCTKCHMAGTGSSKLFDAPLQARADLHPFGRFRDRVVGDTGERRDGFLPPPNYRGPSQQVPPPPGPDLPLATKIQGTVRDEAGKPVAGATVIWSRKRDLPVGRTRTDKLGAYTFDEVLPGEIEIRAGGGAAGIARHTTEVVAEMPQTLDFYLAPERTMSGTVVLPEAAKADGWRVEYIADDTRWTDGTLLRDNTFQLANLPSQKGSMLLWSPHGRLPAAYEPNALAAAGVTFDLTMQGLPEGSLELSLPEEDLRYFDLTASVYQVATGRGTAMMREDNRFALGHLPPGRYRVRLFGPQIGVMELGEHFVDGVTKTDLGVQSLPEPALLRIERPDDDARLEIYQRRRELDVLATPVGQGQFEFLLPPGEWLLMWGAPDAPQHRAVTLGREPTTLELR